ncbi:hypothetical protein J8273_5196 [Carpediemonas membranifera]|uniref:Uncharacterized protein n=1 Tax=Carpediemonas membranifera TaxID=201153 RepID=A0A8J6E0H1_9EUKA|nr:hypothetical protein J8273_5196 [Carpediemonas membranifera]|eukprot:KAG9392213.1 hypothetical protein J8273_5196 [Carpediemonas membranifera]
MSENDTHQEPQTIRNLERFAALHRQHKNVAHHGRRASDIDAIRTYRKQESANYSFHSPSRPRSFSSASQMSIRNRDCSVSPATPRSCLRKDSTASNYSTDSLASQSVRFVLPDVAEVCEDDVLLTPTLLSNDITPRTGCLKNSTMPELLAPVVCGPDDSAADSSILECETVEFSEQSLTHVERRANYPPDSPTPKPSTSTTSKIKQRRKSRQETHDARFRSPFTKVILSTVRPVISGIRYTLDILFL